MIWTPTKSRIITPGTKEWYADQRNVRRGGFWLWDNAGNFRWKGANFLAQTCYKQARKCSDNTLADVWVCCKDTASFPNSFQIGTTGPCYYFGSDAISSSHGTIYVALSLTARGGCLLSPCVSSSSSSSSSGGGSPHCDCPDVVSYHESCNGYQAQTHETVVYDTNGVLTRSGPSCSWAGTVTTSYTHSTDGTVDHTETETDSITFGCSDDGSICSCTLVFGGVNCCDCDDPLPTEGHDCGCHFSCNHSVDTGLLAGSHCEYSISIG